VSASPGPVRVVYSDLDGTMVGPGGCFVRAEDGSGTLEPARALIELHEAGIVLMLVSGRTRPQLLEAARMVGADGFVGEMGAVLGWDSGRRFEVLAGDMPPSLPGSGTPAEVIEATGAVDRLLARHSGRLELHAPWHLGHEADVMLRGRVHPAAVEAELAEEGLGWLRLLDNGALPPVRERGLGSAAEPAHVYHLMPAGLSKGRGVARDLARRGLRPEQAVAVGDSASDLDMAGHVGHLWLTANGARNPEVAAEAAALPNVTVSRGAMGAGWVEAVRSAVWGKPPQPSLRAG
jgi:phosphoglycolate phosphatase